MHLRESLEEILPDKSTRTHFQEIVLGALFSEQKEEWKNWLADKYSVKGCRGYVQDGVVYFESFRVRDGEDILITTNICPVPENYVGKSVDFDIVHS